MEKLINATNAFRINQYKYQTQIIKIQGKIQFINGWNNGKKFKSQQMERNQMLMDAICID
uniref:Uncharacterized protein n=1 Tax=Onchocerca volvulus TaxID=6282 RepID=A0A8R1U2Y1_ONCVO